MFEITRSEVYRYLGYNGDKPDLNVIELVDDVEIEVGSAINAKSVYRIFDVIENDGKKLVTDVLTLDSEALSRNHAGCMKSVFVAATLGARVDILLQKYSQLSPGRAVVMQAVASAAMENYMDLTEDEIRTELGEGLYLRPRFSPGYADLSLDYQKDIFRILDVPKKIGATLMDNLVMAPSKTVTAFIGVSSTDESVHSANRR